MQGNIGNVCHWHDIKTQIVGFSRIVQMWLCIASTFEGATSEEPLPIVPYFGRRSRQDNFVAWMHARRTCGQFFPTIPDSNWSKQSRRSRNIGMYGFEYWLWYICYGVTACDHATIHSASVATNVDCKFRGHQCAVGHETGFFNLSTAMEEWGNNGHREVCTGSQES